MTLLPEVRQELYETAARRAAHPRRRVRVGAGTLVLAGGTIVALLVALAVVIGLGHGARTSQAASRGTKGASSSVRALEHRLAVLRRTQTAADRTYPALLRSDRPRAEALRFEPRLARLAAVVDTPTVGRVRVFVIVRVVGNSTLTITCGGARKPPCPGATAGRGSSPRRVSVHLGTNVGPPGTALVELLAIAGRGVLAGRGPYRAAVGTAPSRAGQLVTQLQRASQLDEPGAVTSGLVSADGYGANPNIGINMSVVPDGVTRVEWVFTGAGFGVSDPRPVTVYPTVQDNVAVAPVEPGEGPIARAVWYGPSGRVIATGRASTTARPQLRLIDAVNASRRNPLPPWLVAHFALFRTVLPTSPARDPTMPLNVQGGGGLALNEWQARYVPSLTGLDGPGLWITPGSHGVCISDPSGGECGRYRSPRTLDSGGFTGASTTASPGEIGRSGIVRKWAETISGLVPDGNSTVTVLLAGGGRRTVPVIDNAWEVTVPRQIIALVDRNAAGRLIHWSMK